MEQSKERKKLYYKIRVSGKNPPEKSPTYGFRGRVSVRLGIGLGLEYGGLSGGIFS